MEALAPELWGGGDSDSVTRRSVSCQTEVSGAGEAEEVGGVGREEGRLMVHCWNTGGLGRTSASDDDCQSSRAAQKLRWIEDWLNREQPTVMVLLEVNGSVRSTAWLRARLRKAGYEMRFMPDAGYGARVGKDRVRHAHAIGRNGVAIAVRTAEARWIRHERVAGRVMGATILTQRDRQRHAVLGIHGQHSSPAFCAQIDAVDAWAERQGGALVIGDFNHVACRKWRKSEPRMSIGDRRVRRLTGRVCTCCGEAPREPTWVFGVEGAQMTRYAVSGGQRQEDTGYLDYAVALGAERGRWEVEEGALVEEVDGSVLSDHRLVGVSRALHAHRGDGWRPSAVRLSEAARAAVPSLYEKGGSSTRRRDAQQAARNSGTAEAAAVTASIKTACELAHDEAAERDAIARRQAAGAAGGTWTKNDELQQWQARRRWALALRREAADPWKQWRFFHFRIRSLRQVREAHRYATSEQIWDAVIRECRQAERRALRRKAQRRKAALEARLGALAAADKAEDAMARLRAVWRALSSRSKAGSSMSAVFVGDDPGNERIGLHDPRFKKELGAIGDRSVRGWHRGAVPAAFRAWCSTFMEPHAPLRSACGDRWSLADELT